MSIAFEIAREAMARHIDELLRFRYPRLIATMMPVPFVETVTFTPRRPHIEPFIGVGILRGWATDERGRRLFEYESVPPSWPADVIVDTPRKMSR